MTYPRERFPGVLVIGAGLAGLSAALAAAPRRTLVLSSSPLMQGCSSAWAQGGVAAALSGDDAPELHADDTVAAAAGLADAEAVERAVALLPDPAAWRVDDAESASGGEALSALARAGWVVARTGPATAVAAAWADATEAGELA